MANTIAHIDTREGLAQPSSTLANDELAYTTAGADRGNQHPPIDGVLTAQAKVFKRLLMALLKAP